MRFLVTGGAGFLGTALANRLARDGHDVQVLDDLSNSTGQGLDTAVQVTEADIDNVPQLWSLLRGVDCVYHLAAKVSVAESILYPRDYSRVNVGGTVSLMEAMRDTGVRRVVFTSSGAVYGRQAEQPVHEDDLPNPDSPYAVSKWAAEQYIHTIGRLWEIETVALRIFNAYGPGQPVPISHAPVVPRFLQQALSGGSLVVFGDGQQTRDFVYVTDVVNALVSAATVGDVNRQVINIGSGIETSMNALVAEMERVLGKSIHRIYNSEKSGGVPRLVADISRAKMLLGLRPLTDLSTGLSQILKEDKRLQNE